MEMLIAGHVRSLDYTVAANNIREFVSTKRAASALQARAATIEPTVSNPATPAIGTERLQ